METLNGPVASVDTCSFGKPLAQLSSTPPPTSRSSLPGSQLLLGPPTGISFVLRLQSDHPYFLVAFITTHTKRYLNGPSRRGPGHTPPATGHIDHHLSMLPLSSLPMGLQSRTRYAISTTRNMAECYCWGPLACVNTDTHKN